MSGAYNRRRCVLGIQPSPSRNLDFLILGDNFFHSKTIIFDKSKNQIGFISNAKNIQVFPKADWLYGVFDGIAVLGLLASVCILMMRKKRNMSKREGELT